MTDSTQYCNGEAKPLRWTKRRKAEILDALARGLVTPTQLEQYLGIGAEELADWRRAFAAGGISGLRIDAIAIRRQALRRRRHR